MSRVAARYIPPQPSRGTYWRRPIALPGERHFNELIKELDGNVRNDLAAELFLRLRGLRNWVESDPDQRQRLTVRSRFPLAAPISLKKPLGILRALADGELQSGSFEAVRACRAVVKWAERRRLPVTAVHFAEACAALAPHSPRALNLAARSNRLLEHTARAEVYYERAITFSRRKGHWAQYVRGNLGLGTIRVAEGNVQAAVDHFRAAARAAKAESGERWLAARTAHDLMLLQADLGSFNEGAETAVHVLEWYGVHNPRFPAAVHDIGMLFVRLGRCDIALPLVELVTRAKIPPVDQPLGWSTYARSAAGVGDHRRYREAAETARALIAEFPLHAAAVFNNLAYGAQALELWDDALEFAREGAAHAKAGTAEACDAQLLVTDTIARRRTAPPTIEPLVGQSWDRLLGLLSDLPRRMAAWRGPTLTKRHEDGPPKGVNF